MCSYVILGVVILQLIPVENPQFIYTCSHCCGYWLISLWIRDRAVLDSAGHVS